MRHDDAEGWPLTPEREYDAQLDHTIWTLERALRAGSSSPGLKRAVVEAHLEQIHDLEERAGVPRPERTLFLGQPEDAPGLLCLPGEGAGADELAAVGRYFHQRGWVVLATPLAHRTLGQPSRAPHYWQTCADEAATRFDILAHCTDRIAVVGAGLSALLALHLASVRRVGAVVALLPPLHVEAPWLVRLRRSLRRIVLRDTTMPPGWDGQRELVSASARETLGRSAVPLYLLVHGRQDRTEEGRSARAAEKLVGRAATEVRRLPADSSAGVRELPANLLAEIQAFLDRQ